MPNRNPRARLSPVEIATLRMVASGKGNETEPGRSQVLLAMGLVCVGEDSKLVLTEEGQQRLPQLLAEIESGQ